MRLIFSFFMITSYICFGNSACIALVEVIVTCSSFLFIADIIQNLIIRRRVFEALRLIYAFGKVNVFPPVPILKTHLMYSFHRAEELNNNGDPSLEIQVK